MRKFKHIKIIRLHHEGTHTLFLVGFGLLLLNVLAYYTMKDVAPSVFYITLGISIFLYAVIVNFFRCPIRVFNGERENSVVAAADGKVVVVEETEEKEYFHDRRIMVSIFMSVTNVHANWFPVNGTIKKVEHQSGNFYKAWLPKSSTENERSTIIIETPDGQEVLVRQIAGAVARRIVTYAQEGDSCFIDEHLGFIKFGSRVDVYLPIGSDIFVELGQRTVGNETVIARLNP
ncbi:MAG: phosphatidylserine decarboxylase family protein [Alloprevotella sp.]|nr:phosphatidylserine decarboxylase family protein [Alloprevotella sp.]